LGRAFHHNASPFAIANAVQNRVEDITGILGSIGGPACHLSSNNGVVVARTACIGISCRLTFPHRPVTTDSAGFVEIPTVTPIEFIVVAVVAKNLPQVVCLARLPTDHENLHFHASPKNIKDLDGDGAATLLTRLVED